MTEPREFASGDLRHAVNELQHRIQEADVDIDQFDDDFIDPDHLLQSCTGVLGDVKGATDEIERVIERLENEDTTEIVSR